MYKHVGAQNANKSPADHVSILSLWHQSCEAHDCVEQEKVCQFVHHFEFQHLSVLKRLVLAEIAHVDHTNEELRADLEPEIIFS